MASAPLSSITSRTFGLPRSLHALGASLVLLPLGIASSVLIARAVGPAGKGSFDLIVATAALLVMLLSLSLPAGVIYAVAQGKSNPGPLAMQLLIVSSLQGLLALAILSALRLTGYAGRFLPDSMGVWIVIGVASYVWVELLTKYWSGMLTGQQQIAVVNNSEVIGRVAQFVMLFTLAGALYLFDKRLSVGALFLVSFSANVFINLLMLKALNPGFHALRDTGALKEATAFAFPSYLANSVQFLNYRLDVFIVGLFAGAASVGRYTLAVSLAQLLWLLSNSAATVLLPKIAASNDRAASVQHVSRVARLSLTSSFAGAIALGLFAWPAIPLLYGSAFRPSVLALWWILPGIVAFSIVNVLAAYLAGIGKPRLNLYVGCVSLVVTVALDFLLIPRLNIVGASVASSASYLTSAVLTTFLFVRITGTPVRDVLIPTEGDIAIVRQLAQPLFKAT